MIRSIILVAYFLKKVATENYGFPCHYPRKRSIGVLTADEIAVGFTYPLHFLLKFAGNLSVISADIERIIVSPHDADTASRLRLDARTTKVRGADPFGLNCLIDAYLNFHCCISLESYVLMMLAQISSVQATVSSVIFNYFPSGISPCIDSFFRSTDA